MTRPRRSNVRDKQSSEAVYGGPLTGVRVIDLTRVLAGPYATMILADLGAEVIKVEDTHVGDTSRLTPPLVNGVSAHFLNLNRGKSSVALNLKSVGGRQAFLDLVKQSDVVVENFRPGTLERLQIGYSELKEVNPSVILCSISGFGQTGSLKDTPSYDVITQALSGAMSVTGEPGRPPVRLGIPVGDLAGGLFGAIAVLSALRERDATGQGQALDVSMMDAVVQLMLYYPLDYLNAGTVAGPVGGRHEHVAPYGVFEVSDGYLVLAVFENKFWRMFCAVIGQSQLGLDPRFRTSADRVSNQTELYAILDDVMKRRGRSEWQILLTDAGIPNAPILTIDQVVDLPLLRERAMFVQLEDAEAGPVSISGRVIKSLDRNQPSLGAAPRHGQHTADLLASIAMKSLHEIAELEADGSIRQHRPKGAPSDEQGSEALDAELHP
jgi:crotonobetainyl-CoA:carnitine CoA-transferase CaiB-like acyl-CoA transferase